MNTILFNQNDLPLTATLLGLLQNYAGLLEQLVNLGGSRYIVSGCVEQGGNVGQGWVVIDGELMEVPTGGSAAGTVYVREQSLSVNVQDGSYTHVVKQLIFGSGENNFPWSEVKRIESIETLEALNTALTNRVNILDGYKPRVEDLEGDVDGLTPRVGDLESGKLNIAQTIESGDLNNYRTAGFYFCASDADASNVSQSPLAGRAFSLLVENTANAKQTWTDVRYQHRTFVRTYHRWTGAWGQWIEQPQLYTSLAQLDLDDDNFSLTDWNANVRAIFDAMPPFSTYKAGNVGASEMPKLNASMLASGIPLAVGGAVTAALEFNKEAHTSAPCLVWAKNNNSARQAYYNVDDSGSEWFEVMHKPADTGWLDVILDCSFDTGGYSNIKARQVGDVVYIQGKIRYYNPSVDNNIFHLPAAISAPTSSVQCVTSDFKGTENKGVTMGCLLNTKQFYEVYEHYGRNIENRINLVYHL